MKTSTIAVDRVVAPAPAQEGDPERAENREDREADDRVDRDQAGSGGAGEGAVGERVSGECRAAQDGEEADDARHDRDDRGDRPGGEHEALEHLRSSSARAQLPPARRPGAAVGRRERRPRLPVVPSGGCPSGRARARTRAGHPESR
jgi:hypothetical protein